MRCLLPLTCLVAAAVVPALHAADTVVEFNPAQTQIHFTLGDLLHTVHGTFRLKSGFIRFDPATGNAEGALIVDAASGDSGSGARDRRMKNNILETGRYPDIVFTPQHVTGKLNPAGPAQLRVEGQFRIHGADHPLTLVVDTQTANGELTASTNFVVPYVQWGMKNPGTFILRVSDKVNIGIQAAATLSSEAAETSAAAK